ncbi:MAG TPA: ABC transporter permease [Methylomusa anaerophila]|uniref:FtsX-like permease family protein n=1 Tax=Methylomusa anaerophila TaxID=1930071 RepID=A0A348AEI2_9FIRM|nr:ABC transporter permease [Methylomusa anaerophila]BBB89480.1 FtsX-like permease family protein [Methylomusa anaerophila]HML89711.1 ABC transporter permease [Methylomusa anaerophila]
MLFLIWKSLLHRRLQSIAIIVSIAVGAAIVFGIAAIYKGVASGLELSKQRMGADIVIVPFDVTLEPSLLLFGGATANSYMPKDLVEGVRAVQGVQRVTPQFFTHSLTADCHDIGTQNRMIGYDPTSDWIIAPWLKKVHKTELKDDEVILGAKVPTWTENKISVLGKWYNIVSVAEETGTTLDYSLLVSMDEARRVVGKDVALKQVWGKMGQPSELISTILVQVDEGADINKVVSDIQNVGLMKPIVAAEVKKRIADQFTVFALLIGGIGVLTILTSLLHLFSRFYALTWERQAEWGLYLAFGASRRDIGAVIVGEAAAVSLAGSVAGLLLGGGLYKGGLKLLEAYQSFPFIQPSWAFIAGIAIGITVLFTGLGALAAWLPAYRGSRIDPSTIMTRGEFD